MKPNLFHAVSSLTMAALIIGQTGGVVMPSAAFAQDQPVATVSNPVVQQLGGETQSAAPQAAVEAPPPVEETAAERKARLKAEKKAQKQAAKEEKKRLAAEEKARKRAEKQKNGGNGVGRSVLACVVGGGAGAVIGRVFGAKKTDLLGSAVAGCLAGIAFAALTKKDNEELNAYVQNDFMVHDDGNCSSTWVAPESQTEVALSCGETTVQQAQHSFFMEEDVTFDQSNFQAAEVAKYSTASLRLRSSPTTSQGNNIIGGFAAGDKVLTYGTTNDGEWTYVVDSLPDGQYELLGYVSSAYLSAKPPRPAARSRSFAKVQPVAKQSNRAAIQRASADNADVRPTKQVVASANTRCKTVNVTVGQETKSQSSCGGARLALVMPVNGEERNV